MFYWRLTMTFINLQTEQLLGLGLCIQQLLIQHLNGPTIQPLCSWWTYPGCTYMQSTSTLVIVALVLTTKVTFKNTRYAHPLQISPQVWWEIQKAETFQVVLIRNNHSYILLKKTQCCTTNADYACIACTMGKYWSYNCTRFRTLSFRQMINIINKNFSYKLPNDSTENAKSPNIYGSILTWSYCTQTQLDSLIF